MDPSPPWRRRPSPRRGRVRSSFLRRNASYHTTSSCADAFWAVGIALWACITPHGEGKAILSIPFLPGDRPHRRGDTRFIERAEFLVVGPEFRG